MEYRTVETSREVWAVIRARHPELVPHGTASFECDVFRCGIDAGRNPWSWAEHVEQQQTQPQEQL
jgi:hypothetical protein